MSPFLAGVRGAAWVAVAAIYASAICMYLALPGRFQGIEYNFIGLVPGTFFLLCLAASRGTYRKPALIAWMLLALVNLVASLAQDAWGENAIDLSEPFGSRYRGYTFLSDGLFAFGCLVLLVTGILLIWKEWKRPDPAA